MRKKLLCTVILSLTLLLTGCSVDIASKITDAVDRAKPITEQEAVVELQQAPLQKTEFKFHEPEVSVAPETGNIAQSRKTINMYLDNGIYYPIEVPSDLKFVTDNAKYLYALDDSVEISVVSGIDTVAFSSYVSIDKPEKLTPTLIVSQLGVKGPQEAALHVVNDKAIIVRTYNNPDAYATILSGLERNRYVQTTYTNVEVVDKVTRVMDKLPTYDGYKITVNAGLAGELQKIYSFNSGSLTVSSELRRMDMAIENLSTKLAVVADTSIADVYYRDKSVYYVEIGDYVIGIYDVNYNTVLTCFGCGSEAKANTVAFLESQCK